MLRDPNSLKELTSEIATKQNLTGNTFTVATLPAAAANVGRVVYVTNGKAGAACAAISDGTNWKVVDIGATAAAA
jgi:subtilisin family serine protease